MKIKWQHKYEMAPGKWVFVPTEESRVEGNRIKKAIESRWFPPSYYFHLRCGGHLAALYSHIESQFFLRLDIQDFFGSVNRSRVTRCLKNFFDYDEARRMANASTVKHPSLSGNIILPYGFVQSPILASLALFNSALGSCLDRFNKQQKIFVSVYMDDIIVSSKNSDSLIEVQAELEQAAKKSRFDFHSEKKEGPALKVTAFNINISNNELLITNQRMFDFINIYKLSENENQRDGIKKYISSVNEVQVDELI